MHVAVRPHLTAGVALACAGAIAVSPLSPAAPDIPLPAVNTSVVELTTQANPIEAWLNVFGGLADNVTKIGGQVADDPAPILRQVIANQVGYAQTLATGLGGLPVAFNNWATVTLPAALQLASDRIAQDNIVGAATAINNALGAALLALGGMFGAASIPGQMTDNLTNAVHALTGLGTLMSLAVAGVLNPIQATVAAAGDSGQAFVNAMNAGDQAEALTALVNIPAAMTSGFLNGVQNTRVPGHPEIPGHGAFSGLFTFRDNPSQGGLVQQLLVALPRTIAAAITPPAPPAAPADVASAPAPAPTTVTLDTVTLDKVPTSTAIEAAEPEVQPKEKSAPTIKLGNKAVPGAVKSHERTKPADALRKSVKAALGKVGIGKRAEATAGDEGGASSEE